MALNLLGLGTSVGIALLAQQSMIAAALAFAVCWLGACLWNAAWQGVLENGASGQRAGLEEAVNAMQKHLISPSGARLQMAIRAIFAVVMGAPMVVIAVLAWLTDTFQWSMIEQSPAARPAEQRSLLPLAFSIWSGWVVLVWISSNGHRGYDFLNYLGRAGPLEVAQTLDLEEKGYQKNRHACWMQFLVSVIGLLLVVLLPPLVLMLEPARYALMTLAAREIFEGKAGLAPLEACVPAVEVRPAI